MIVVIVIVVIAIVVIVIVIASVAGERQLLADSAVVVVVVVPVKGEMDGGYADYPKDVEHPCQQRIPAPGARAWVDSEVAHLYLPSTESDWFQIALILFYLSSHLQESAWAGLGGPRAG